MKNRIKRHLIPGSRKKPVWHHAWLTVTLLGKDTIHIDVHEKVITIGWTDYTHHYRIVIDIDSGATSMYSRTNRNGTPDD